MKKTKKYLMTPSQKQVAFEFFPLVKFLYEESKKGLDCSELALKANRSKYQVVPLILSWRKKGLKFPKHVSPNEIGDNQYQKNYMKEFILKKSRKDIVAISRGRRIGDYFNCICGHVHTFIFQGIPKNDDFYEYKCPVDKSKYKFSGEEITMTSCRSVLKELLPNKSTN